MCFEVVWRTGEERERCSRKRGEDERREEKIEDERREEKIEPMNERKGGELQSLSLVLGDRGARRAC